MSNLQNLNDNPEVAKWLEGLKKRVEENRSHRTQESAGESKIFLPTIDMSRKFRQVNNKTYPEMQGTISLLPVPYKGERLITVNNILRCWCPADDQWTYGFTYKILPSEYYPETVRPRITEIRNKLEEMLNSGKITWKECKRGSVGLMLGYVIQHRNTRSDLISSNLFGGDTLVEHKNVPALIVLPSSRVESAIQDDLDTKSNPIPYALATYSSDPLKDRKGWMTIKFTSSTSSGFGYDVKVTTEMINPIVMPDGLLPKEFNEEDERVKLLNTTDPIYNYLDRRQVGSNGEYWSEESLIKLESFVNYLQNK